MTDLTLYDYLPSCNCYKVRLLLAQLGRPYTRVDTDIFAGDTLTDDFARKNPLRMTPVLELADGRVLLESAAILVYLAEGTPFLPDDAFARAEVLRWLVYEQTDIIPATGGLRFRLVTGRLAPGDADVERRRTIGADVLAVIEGHLATRTFFVGERYSVADIAVYGYVHLAHESGYDMAAYPHVTRWLERVRAQPGYVNDLLPYPANARAGGGDSIYG